MENLNLPPFLKGDKVVYIGPSNNGYVKGKVYLVAGIKKSCQHSIGPLIVSVGIPLPVDKTNNCECCGYDNSIGGCIGLTSKLFRKAVESKFLAVSFEKIMEETEKICVN